MLISYAPDFAATELAASLSPSQLSAHGVDAQISNEDKVYCSLWWRQVPSMTNERLGVIGHFRAHETATAANVSETLHAACDALKQAGCTLAIGPMDGNTWRSYRFLTWRGDEPRFAFEPDQPSTWPTWWQQAGFTASEEYWSALMTNLAAHDPRLDGVALRLQRHGITVRPVDLDNFADELARIFSVSESAFRDNVLYTPLSQTEFMSMYQPVQPLMRPSLSFLAERGDEPVGFVFALPDLEQAKRGSAIDTVVVKTLAVRPGRECAGLGKLLLEQCHHAAHAQGFRRAIHALMHNNNTSRNLGDGAVEMRRYTLYARRLT